MNYINDVFWKKRSGFTLIELMIVIAIIGILSAISIPNFIQYRMRAEYISLIVNLEHMMDAEDLYFLENNTYYPANGKINIKKGKSISIPGVNYSFSSKKHRYRIITKHKVNKKKKKTNTIDYCYIKVWPSIDFNGDGKQDVFNYMNYTKNGVRKYHHKLIRVK